MESAASSPPATITKTRDDLTKSINSYFDLKENCKYLIYFTTLPTENESKDIGLYVTNGVSVWTLNITNELFVTSVLQKQLESKLSLIEFLAMLGKSIKRDEFELNKIIDTENLTDVIELETKSSSLTNNNSSSSTTTTTKKTTNTNISVKLLLRPVKSSVTELKEFMFQMFNKFNRTETELNKLNIRIEALSGNAIGSELTSGSPNVKATSNYTNQARRFNMSKNQVANIIAPRNSHMSIINPMTKRRKTPKGVEFDDDDNEDDSNDTESDDRDEKISSPKKAICK